MKKRFSFAVFIVSFFASYLTAFIGSLFTVGAVKSEWYSSIKPSITPPDYVFPIVWNVLFFLIGLSLFLAWTSADKKTKPSIAKVFGVNLLLNILWSVLYFWLRNPLASLIEIFFLAVSIVFMIRICYKVNKLSGRLLIPYLLWVCFAIVLNYLTVLNWL